MRLRTLCALLLGAFSSVLTMRGQIAPSFDAVASGNGAAIPSDAPPAYEWRGCMIDVSRHFFPIDFLKRQVDLLAPYGINRLHLHLTDAAGWRFVMPGYPRLTSLGAWRTQSDWTQWWENGDRQYLPEGTAGAYGGYYTEAQLRELVAYAAAKGITVVPEVEFPGHSEEVTTAYPELKCEGNDGAQDAICPSNPLSYRFIDDVLTEIVRIFPSDYIHIGGDEASKVHWRTCPRCRAMAQRLGLASTDLLQDHLVRYAMRKVVALGRKPIGWDDALCDSLPEGTAIMVWNNREMAHKVLEKGYDVIYTPLQHCYLDYAQDAPLTQPRSFGGYQPLKRVYEMRPPKGVMGVQGNLWTEFIETTAHVEYMLYPRMLAVAMVGMLGEARPDFPTFRRWALRENDRLRREGVNAFDLRHEAGDRPESLRPIRHKALGAKVTYAKPYAPNYSAGGAQALVDGKRGNWEHIDGRWQGFLTDSCMDFTLDFGKPLRWREISMDFLQADVAWIFLPKEIRISTSDDGRTFREIFRRTQAKTPRVISFIDRWQFKGAHQARYLRIEGIAQGEGAWIFTDEIVLK